MIVPHVILFWYTKSLNALDEGEVITTLTSDLCPH